jgi:hypothetical protein
MHALVAGCGWTSAS